MSKGQALEAIIQKALGDEDPIGPAHLVSTWLEREREADYSHLSTQAAREKATQLRAALEVLNNGYMAACAVAVGAPANVASFNAGQGGKAKQSKNAEAAAKAAAKAAVQALWPTANRKGWTAERIYTQLAEEHRRAVKADTVRKWVTSLRKTGTC